MWKEFINTKENTSASWLPVQRQDLKQKPTKTQKIVCHCVPRALFQLQHSGDLSAKIPSRNSPQRESTKTECGGIKGDLKDWRMAKLSSSAPALYPPSWCGAVGIRVDTNTVQSYTGQGLSSGHSWFMWIYFGTIHWHSALEMKIP